MLVEAKRSCLLVVDMQEKLLPAVADTQTVLSNNVWLVKAAIRLGVSILTSEQYPKGLGHTVPELSALMPDFTAMEKTHFSCTAEPTCRKRIMTSRREQIILTGIEAHVCVLQTALGLLEMEKEVYVVADCTGSRQPYDQELALARMRTAGIQVVSREMVLFEWLHQSDNPLFREVSREFLR
jgi:nicotinamidase-related amidase